jgi:hypothetical protein
MTSTTTTQIAPACKALRQPPFRKEADCQRDASKACRTDRERGRRPWRFTRHAGEFVEPPRAEAERNAAQRHEQRNLNQRMRAQIEQPCRCPADSRE